MSLGPDNVQSKTQDLESGAAAIPNVVGDENDEVIDIKTPPARQASFGVNDVEEIVDIKAAPMQQQPSFGAHDSEEVVDMKPARRRETYTPLHGTAAERRP